MMIVFLDSVGAYSESIDEQFFILPMMIMRFGYTVQIAFFFRSLLLASTLSLVPRTMML
jgi:hypothetical protein